MQTSARRGIQSPSLDRSDRPDIPLHLSYLVAALEKDPSLDQGAAASRPTNPGYARYFYWATDNKVLYFWDGSTWTGVGSTDTIPIGTIDAKGDLLVGLGDNTVARLGVGVNGLTLQADNAQPGGMKWALDQVLDVIAAKGDLLVGTSADHLDRVGVGLNGQTVIADSTQATGVRWGSAPVQYSQPTDLASPFTVTAANTYQNVMNTASLAAGTWRIAAHCSIQRVSGGMAFAKLYDGTNPAYCSAAQTLGNAGDISSISMSKIIVLTGPTQIYLAVASDAANNIVVATLPGSFAAGATATHLEAIQLA